MSNPEEHYWDDDRIRLVHGDCRNLVATLPDGTVDACVTDPPYEINFMGENFDRQGIAFDETFWRDVLRTLKPGAHLLAFGATRTVHRLACSIEDSGFEIRGQIDWIHADAMPHGMDAATAARREGLPAPARFAGWNSALKPAHEPIVLARKPLAGTLAANMAEHGVGALHVGACGVDFKNDKDKERSQAPGMGGVRDNRILGAMGKRMPYTAEQRFPTDILIDHAVGGMIGDEARFFPCFTYQPKANTRERPDVDGVIHPTVKPVELMRWLVRLATPHDGLVLEPFAGSGSTLEACRIEGFRCVASEKDERYIRLIEQRMSTPNNGVLDL